jgi:hypothetical protein
VSAVCLLFSPLDSVLCVKAVLQHTLTAWCFRGMYLCVCVCVERARVFVYLVLLPRQRQVPESLHVSVQHPDSHDQLTQSRRAKCMWVRLPNPVVL